MPGHKREARLRTNDPGIHQETRPGESPAISLRDLATSYSNFKQPLVVPATEPGPIAPGVSPVRKALLHSRPSSPAKAGDPVFQSVRVHHQRSGILGRPVVLDRVEDRRRAMTTRCDSSFSRRTAPEVCKETPPPKERGRREDRVRAAPAVSCALCIKKRSHMSIQVQRKHSGLPCAMALRLIRALPDDQDLLTPSSTGYPANLTPTLGRQDHTPSPYASVPFVIGTSASTASRPAFVTIASRPSWWDGMRASYR
jgi:hypothetical protein